MPRFWEALCTKADEAEGRVMDGCVSLIEIYTGTEGGTERDNEVVEPNRTRAKPL